MPMRDDEVVVVDQPPLNAAEAFFLPEVFRGLGTTLRHMLNRRSEIKTNRRGMKTLEYPDERKEELPIDHGGLHVGNFRGVHRLNRDEEGRVKCVACFMCATACPARCIHIEGAESPWDDREKYPIKFDIDELRCIYCGMCEEACPVDAIELTQTYDLVGLTRQEMIFDKEKLLAVYDATVAKKPM